VLSELSCSEGSSGARAAQHPAGGCTGLQKQLLDTQVLSPGNCVPNQEVQISPGDSHGECVAVMHIFVVSVDLQVVIQWSVLQVVKDEQLREAIEAAAQHDYSKTGEEDDELHKDILQRHEARATKILYDMRSTLSDFLLR
jgi:hypothetical protein